MIKIKYSLAIILFCFSNIAFSNSMIEQLERNMYLSDALRVNTPFIKINYIDVAYSKLKLNNRYSTTSVQNQKLSTTALKSLYNVNFVNFYQAYNLLSIDLKTLVLDIFVMNNTNENIIKILNSAPNKLKLELINLIVKNTLEYDSLLELSKIIPDDIKCYYLTCMIQRMTKENTSKVISIIQNANLKINSIPKNLQNTYFDITLSYLHNIARDNLSNVVSDIQNSNLKINNINYKKSQSNFLNIKISHLQHITINNNINDKINQLKRLYIKLNKLGNPTYESYFWIKYEKIIELFRNNQFNDAEKLIDLLLNQKTFI